MIFLVLAITSDIGIIILYENTHLPSITRHMPILHIGLFCAECATGQSTGIYHGGAMNRENFKRVLDTIRANPESWNQHLWHSECGTAHCFAGHAEILSGVRSDEFSHVFEIAQEWLGLTDKEASYIFKSSRTMEDFEEFYRAHIDLTTPETPCRPR